MDEFDWYRRLNEDREKSGMAIICPDCLRPIPTIETLGSDEACTCGYTTTIAEMVKVHGLDTFKSIFTCTASLDIVAEVS